MDVLSRNHVDVTKPDEDLVNEIQDYKMLQYTWKSKETLWMGKRSSKDGFVIAVAGKLKTIESFVHGGIC